MSENETTEKGRFVYGCPDCGRRVISTENEVWCYECPSVMEQITEYTAEQWRSLHTRE